MLNISGAIISVALSVIVFDTYISYVSIAIYEYI